MRSALRLPSNPDFRSARSVFTLLAAIAILWPLSIHAEEAPAGPEVVESANASAVPRANVQAAFEFAIAKILLEENDIDGASEAFYRARDLAPDDPYIRIELANALGRMGRFPQALEEAEAAVERAPENTDALKVLGQVLWSFAGTDPASLDRAEKVLDRLVELDPIDIQSTLALGQLYLARGEAKRAADRYLILIKAAPLAAGLYSRMVESLLRNQATAATERVLVGVLEVEPGYLEGRLQLAELLNLRGDSEAAKKVLEGAPDVVARDPELMSRLALDLYRSGDYGAALATLGDLIEAHPESREPLFQRALLLAEMGRIDDALSEFASLAKLGAMAPDAVAAYAGLLEQSGRSGDAVALLGDYLARLSATADDDILFAIGAQRLMMLARGGEWDAVLQGTDGLLQSASDQQRRELLMLKVEALSATDRADEALALLDAVNPGEQGIALQAKQAVLLYELDRPGAATAKVDRLARDGSFAGLLMVSESLQRVGDFDHAIPVLRRALELEPESTEALFWLGAAYERTHLAGEAIEIFEQLIELVPDFAPALNYLGYMLAERGEDLETALDLVERAVAIEPDNGAYIDSLGWAHFQLGQLDEALEQLQRASELVPGDGVVFEHLGDAYRALGELAKARDSYDRAIVLESENLSSVQEKLQTLGDG